MQVNSIAATTLTKAFDRLNSAATKIADATGPEQLTDTVDIAAAVIELSAAKIDAAVGVRLLRAEQELVKNTLDILA